ncbi:DinB family protein [Lottiidibacillus patelloidae]
MMNFKIEEAIEILERTPKVLHALLGGLSLNWIDCHEGDGTWSPKEVLAHLIEGENEDWIKRLELCIEHGVNKPFKPFDRFSHLQYVNKKTMEELLNTFSELRYNNILRLNQLITSPKTLELKGRHPDFGTVTVKELLATWVSHDLNHIVQINRTMANRYRDDVGPWIEYLGIYR